VYKISIVIPTYNERENVPLLVDELYKSVSREKAIDLELIIVDDNSPDGTGLVADELSHQYPIKVIHRKGKMGLGSAVMEGFKLSDRPYVGVMDADLSHDPVILAEMIRNLGEYDIVIGSRFNDESSVEKWRLDRKLISITGVWLAKHLTHVSDPLSGYFMLKRVVLDDLSLTSPGYKILLEILVKGCYSKVKEIPFRFRTREYSVSKLNTSEYLLFIKQLLVFFFRRKNRKCRLN
jgi:dolichol-phosphate mannosyltransferase